MLSKFVVFLSFFLLWNPLNLSAEEVDYVQMFNTIKKSLSPTDISNQQAIEITDQHESIEALQNGLNAYNLFAPYQNMEKDLKEIMLGLSSYKFTLRSASSINIYQVSAPATLLVVAPLAEGSGAGFLIDKQNRLAVTNYHVTSGLRNLLVAFYDEDEQDSANRKYFSANVIRYSAKKDVAILRLSSVPASIPELRFDSVSERKVGETVYTIGHPLSLAWTFSKGLITAIRKNFQFGEEERADVIQIDASISPGNSGGPLLNESGKVIGMVTFSASSEYAQNLNFAVSKKDIEEVVRSRKNEDTDASKILNEMYGLQLLTLNDVMEECKAYKIDEDKDGTTDYISLVEKSTGIELFRLLKNFEIEVEQGKKLSVNILCMDINRDEIMDIFLLDYDGNNYFESMMADINGDGEPDIAGIDAEGKGMITEAWIIGR